MEEKKRCIHCGAELPEDASFCPVCAQSQVERQKVSPPRRRWKRPLTIFVTLVIIIAVAGVSVWRLGNVPTYSDIPDYDAWSAILAQR